MKTAFFDMNYLLKHDVNSPTNSPISLKTLLAFFFKYLPFSHLSLVKITPIITPNKSRNITALIILQQLIFIKNNSFNSTFLLFYHEKKLLFEGANIIQ